MTVAISYDPVNYVAAGVGPYAVPWPVENTSCIKVLFTNALGQVSAPIFTATTTAVTLSASPGTGTLKIYRETTDDQPVRLSDLGPFPAQAVEQALDHAAYRLQELQAQVEEAGSSPVANTSVSPENIPALAQVTPAGRSVAAPNQSDFTITRVLSFDEISRDGVDMRWLIGASQTASQSATLQAALDNLLSDVSQKQRTKPLVIFLRGQGQRVTLDQDLLIRQWYVHMVGAGLELYFQQGGLKLSRAEPNYTLSNKLRDLVICGSGRYTHTGVLLDLFSAPKTIVQGGSYTNGEHGIGMRGSVNCDVRPDRIESIGKWGVREEPIEVVWTGTVGTITTSTASPNVTGTGTFFNANAFRGLNLYTADGVTLIGTVSSVTNDGALVLTGNAGVNLTGQAFVRKIVNESQGNTFSCPTIQNCGDKSSLNSSLWTGGAIRVLGGVGSSYITPIDMESNARGAMLLNTVSLKFGGRYCELNGDLGDVYVGQINDANLPIALTNAEKALIVPDRVSEANIVTGMKTGGQADPAAVGTITTSLASQTVTGSGAQFLTRAYQGMEIFCGEVGNPGYGNRIGTVQTVTNDNTLTLVANALVAQTNKAFLRKVTGVAIGKTTGLVTGLNQLGGRYHFKDATSNAQILPDARRIDGVQNNVGATVSLVT
jgi:hypothetical protein